MHRTGIATEVPRRQAYLNAEQRIIDDEMADLDLYDASAAAT